MKDKISMPLIEAMLQYKSEDVYPLHTPDIREDAACSACCVRSWVAACRWTCR